MFLTPEEKIVYLRKKYDLTQNDLSSIEIKRQFIGMIEIGKRGLTKNTAEIICKNFNLALKNKNINDEITVEFLLETKEEQALKKLSKIIENDDLRNDLEIDICFSELKEVNKKKFAFLLGEFYLKLKEIKLSKKYFEIALFLYKPLENIDIILQLTRIYYYLDQFKETVDLVKNYTFALLKDLNEINFKILYNYAYSLYKINNFEDSIDVFNKLLKITKDSDLIFKIKNMLAIIYYSKLGKIRKALNVYASLFEVSSNENKLVIYGNYLELWLLAKKGIDVEQTILDIENFLKNYETTPNHLFKIYILLAKSYYELNQQEDSYYYYMEALKIPDNKFILIEKKYQILLELLDLFMLIDDELDSIIDIFYILFKEEKDYKTALLFIKKIKNEKKQLKLLTNLKV